MVSDVATATAVSGWVTLRRTAVGAGLALASCVLIGLLGRPAGAFADASVLIWSIIALYSGYDRHARAAGAAAAVTAVLIWLGTAPLLDGGTPGHVARALLGVLLAGQVYALISNLGQAVPIAGSEPQER
ncbi:hypothetical protein [Actinoplanes sp. L3-i22]|uniref:hypothetical protein n=1 Tax=Actinoplanes sp. L3-i22 TaxID=2836373 RepID=UPI001C78D1E3|nr:hypothetical protein [Actinoplanes sp. L3-i22]BCY12636.1 hypothetical protein L3i22_077240 [Actinoplanes sp. L3-i22]